MKSAVALTLGAALLMASGVAAARSEHRSDSQVLAIEIGTNSAKLVRVHAGSLSPASGKSFRFDSYSGAWAENATRTRVALATQSGRVLVVTVPELTSQGEAPLSRGSQIDYMEWASAEELLVVYNDLFVAAIDAQTMAIRWSKKVVDTPYEAVASASGYLLFIEPPRDGGVGPTRFVRVDGRGHVRDVSLARIRTGSVAARSGSSVESGTEAGLAVSPDSKLAFVAASQQPIATVAVESLVVSYHLVQRTVSTAQKGLVGADWSAVGLGTSTIAVTGVVGSSRAGGPPGTQIQTKPFGLRLIDLRSGVSRILDNQTSAVEWTGASVLAFGAQINPSKNSFVVHGRGLAIYSPTGKSLLHLFGSEPITNVFVIGHDAYVQRQQNTLTRIDIRTNRRLSTSHLDVQVAAIIPA